MWTPTLLIIALSVCRNVGRSVIKEVMMVYIFYIYFFLNFYNNSIIATFEEQFDIFVNAFIHFLAELDDKRSVFCIMHVAGVCLFNGHQGAIPTVVKRRPVEVYRLDFCKHSCGEFMGSATQFR